MREGGGEGRGRERRKRDLANTIAWARFWPTRQLRMLEIWPVFNMAVCTTSRCTDFDFDNALRFALQNRCSPDLKLKLKQLEVVKAIVQQRRHVLAVLPTGYGKSLTYQFVSKHVGLLVPWWKTRLNYYRCLALMAYRPWWQISFLVWQKEASHLLL